MTTVLRGAQVFDGERLTKGRTIVVDGAMIGGAEREVDVVDLVDLDGATLLPGLVDTHQAPRLRRPGIVRGAGHAAR